MPSPLLPFLESPHSPAAAAATFPPPPTTTRPLGPHSVDEHWLLASLPPASPAAPCKPDAPPRSRRNHQVMFYILSVNYLLLSCTLDVLVCLHFCGGSVLCGSSVHCVDDVGGSAFEVDVAEEDWKTKRELLLQKRVRSVDVKEALRLQQENNFVILDVRPEAEFKEAHPQGAINVQIYRLIKEWTPWDIARRAAFLFFGILSGTEENPEFLKIVESKLEKDAKIIVACSSGGTMRPSQNFPEGQQSRSLIAAYLLVLNGYTNVFHLEGGLSTWFNEGLPSVAEE
uniref:Rhodanese-like domain-containing protein 14, chloroplastic n=1 Tax=Anthurium amnicola TaxID=1678845 RepID=A0A1D1XQK9_9ARAE